MDRKRAARGPGIALLVALLASWMPTSHAVEISDLQPSTLFVQAGFAEDNTNSYVAGATWDWHWRRQTGLGTLTGFFEASAGRWSTDTSVPRDPSWATQVGITPVLRLQPAAWGTHWFAEAGVGANVILPIFRSSRKRFSTDFNFGDHMAVGRMFGAERQHELVLRLQHFSNAGIDHPNPGENFVQLRYAHRL
jgi:hypothetical protein